MMMKIMETEVYLLSLPWKCRPKIQSNLTDDRFCSNTNLSINRPQTFDGFLYACWMFVWRRQQAVTNKMPKDATSVIIILIYPLKNNKNNSNNRREKGSNENLLKRNFLIS